MTAVRVEELSEAFPWEDAEADVDPESWVPSDLATPERLMRQLARLNSKIDHIQAEAGRMREPIDRWERDQLEPLRERAAYLDQSLQEIARRYRAADEKHNKTLRLPSGEVRSSSTNPRVAVEDEAQVVAFLRNYVTETGAKVEDFLAVSVSVKPKLDPLKKLATIIETDEGLVAAAHGEPIPGVSVVPGGVTFRVNPS